MKLFMFLTILLQVYVEVKGHKELSIENDKCQKLRSEAGCDENGHLLHENVCIDDDYQSHDPPNSTPTVDIFFLEWPKILAINERSSTIKIHSDFLVFEWQDPRVRINLNDLENETILLPPFKRGEQYRLLTLPFQNMCNSLTKYELGPVVWTPINQGIRITEAIRFTNKDENNPWGIEEFGLIFTTPVNESTPLINMRMNFIVMMACEFEYIGYPMDTQNCSLTFSSHKMKPFNLSLYDPAGMCSQRDKAYQMNGFHVSSYCMIQAGTPHQVGINFTIERDVTSYLLQYYLPSAIIVLVSQTSFVIPLSAIPGRISLVVTQFLALTNIFINLQVMKVLIRVQLEEILDCISILVQIQQEI